MNVGSTSCIHRGGGHRETGEGGGTERGGNCEEEGMRTYKTGEALQGYGLRRSGVATKLVSGVSERRKERWYLQS